MKGFAADYEVIERIQQIREFLGILKEKRCHYQVIVNKIRVFHGFCMIGEYNMDFGNILKEADKHLKFYRNY